MIFMLLYCMIYICYLFTGNLRHLGRFPEDPMGFWGQTHLKTHPQLCPVLVFCLVVMKYFIMGKFL